MDPISNESKYFLKVRMSATKGPIPLIKEWEIVKALTLETDPERGAGDGHGGGGVLTTLGCYYEEDADDGNVSSSGGSGSRLTSTYPSASSSSLQTIPEQPGDPVDCKTYDFRHTDAEKDYILTDGELFQKDLINQWEDASGSSSLLNRNIFPDNMRSLIQDYYKITHRERMTALQNSNASFPLCPRGDCSETISGCRSRKQPGPFLMCPFSESHECGDDFFKVGLDTKRLADFEPTARPPHFKERKTKFFKQCKNCETLGFVHHRNPAQHYEDYVNTVTYEKHMNQAKVWQQHLADLKFSLSDRDPQYEDIAEKCRPYKPSPIIIHATRYSRAPPALRKRSSGSVLTRKRAFVRRTIAQRKSSAVSSIANSVSRLSTAKQAKSELDNDNEDDADLGMEFLIQASSSKRLSKNLAGKSFSSGGKSTNSQTANASIPKRVSKTAGKKQPSSLGMNSRMKASMTKLMRFRQAQSRHSSAVTTKRFVKRNQRQRPRTGRKPKQLPPPAKYIPQLKPNISARMLQRNKSKEQHPRVNRTKTATAPGTSGNSVGNKAFKSGKTFNDNDANQHDSEDGADESYAQFRDRDGNFDTEKYRQSILKMLEQHSGSGARRRKKETRSERQGEGKMGTIPSLPQIKNPYKNVKSKTVSNLPNSTRQSKKSKKGSKGEMTLESLIGQTISEISLKNKYSSSERYFERIRDGGGDRYSVPGVDDL